MKLFNQAKQFGSKALAVAGLGIASAHAAVDTTVTTALSDGLTDTKTIGAAALIIVIAVAVFKKMRSAA